ncbi:MAG: hypothetical protein M3Z21_13540, partial [Pseudomonadota bacterium]|nr:hypothetical protein [Pseudomonadota bacterium]
MIGDYTRARRLVAPSRTPSGLDKNRRRPHLGSNILSGNAYCATLRSIMNDHDAIDAEILREERRPSGERRSA